MNIATGVETRTQSNAAGVYAILNILPGDYTLSATQTGIRHKDYFGIPIGSKPDRHLRFFLGVEYRFSSQLTVEATASEVQASTAELGAVVGRQQVVDLPLNGRNFTQLLTFTPGASPVEYVTKQRRMANRRGRPVYISFHQWPEQPEQLLSARWNHKLQLHLEYLCAGSNHRCGAGIQSPIPQ